MPETLKPMGSETRTTTILQQASGLDQHIVSSPWENLGDPHEPAIYLGQLGPHEDLGDVSDGIYSDSAGNEHSIRPKRRYIKSNGFSSNGHEQNSISVNTDPLYEGDNNGAAGFKQTYCNVDPSVRRHDLRVQGIQTPSARDLSIRPHEHPSNID